jgi:hypothetical protein
MAAVIVAVTFVFGWFVTYGTGRLFEPDDERSSFADRFFAAQAESLLDGRVDVPREVIEFEAYLYNGKYHGYFGIGTSLLRIPLMLLFPGSQACWNRPLFVVACLVNLTCAYLLLLTARQLFLPGQKPTGKEKWLYALFVIVAGLGSTNIYLGSRSFLYHEPIIWGAAFALLSYYALLRYVMRPALGTLALACVFSLFAFLTRAPQGLGTTTALTLLAFTVLLDSRDSKTPRLPLTRPFHRRSRVSTFDGKDRSHAFCALGFVVVSFAAFFLVNYAKFGTVSGMPLHLYVRYQFFNQQADYERIEGKAFHLSNAPTMLVNYFAPGKVEFRPQFPWVYATDQPTLLPGAKLDLCGEFASLTAGQPALLFLAVLGTYSVFFARPRNRGRKMRLPLIGAAAAGAVDLIYTVISERYTHDFYPFLILAGAAGVHQVLTLRRPGWRVGASVCFIVLSCFSVYANLAFALVHQREILVNYGFGNMWSDEKGEEFRRWRGAMDSWWRGLSRRPAPPPPDGGIRRVRGAPGAPPAEHPVRALPRTADAGADGRHGRPTAFESDGPPGGRPLPPRRQSARPA